MASPEQTSPAQTSTEQTSTEQTGPSPVDAARRAIAEDPDGVLVCLDYDGVLAPIVDDPAEARPLPGTIEAVGEIARRVGLLAVVTGRPARTVVRLASLDALSGHRVVVRGAYGVERWDARTGEFDEPPPPVEIEQARAALTALVDQEGHGVALEEKGRALAIHTRRAGDPRGAFDRLRPQVAELAERLGLRFEPGRLVLEVRQLGVDKGAAVRELAGALPTGGPARTILYAGDDLGDTPAFEAARELGASGVTVLRIGVQSAETKWPDGLVDVLVDGPEGLLALLQRIIADEDPVVE